MLAWAVVRSAGSKRAQLDDFRIRIKTAQPTGREAVREKARAIFGGRRPS